MPLIFKKRHDDNQALFIQYGKNAKAATYLRLSPRAVQRMLKVCAVKAGITEVVTPHSLRHSFAIDLLRKGSDLKSVQTRLGHATILTTQIYTRVTEKILPHV